MTTKHIHEFHLGRSGNVETCRCGRFRFTEKYLAENESITEDPVALPQLPNSSFEADGDVCETESDMERARR